MTKVVTKARARAVLNERFGHTDFRAGQWEPVRAVLSGHDALVVMPTGSGKSLVYQLPALMLPVTWLCHENRQSRGNNRE